MLSSRSTSASSFRKAKAPHQLHVSIVKLRCNASAQPATTTSQAETTQYAPLPRNVQEMVDQCTGAVEQATSGGKNRHIVEFLNPVNEKAVNFLSTEAMEYPESTFSEFERIIGVTKNFITKLLGEEVGIKVKRIDEGGIDGDLCAIVSSEGKQVVCVVWPTAEKLKQIKSLAEDKSIGRLVIVNALWKTQGNLVSEFGIGPWRKANEEFVATFEPTYSLYEQRIGAPSSINMASGTRYATGGVVRVQRCFPGPYEVHVMAPNGVSQAVGAFPLSGGKPTYNALDALIVAARQAKLEIFDVARKASSLAIERGDEPATQGEGADGSENSGPAFYDKDQILNMDVQQLRRVLLKLGLPTSGTLTRLQQRALAVVEAVQGGDSLEKAVDKAKKLR